ncbi:MAG: acyl-coenzyme A thioesterase PaaI-like protein [Myxococcota bacterium]|jgi:acyl-coenzyme A thioesterase PaaI-like protein
MKAPAALQKFMPSMNNPGNAIRDTWLRLAKVPMGSRIFSKILGVMAPYTGTIGAQVVELREGYAKVTLEDRKAVRNHLRCVHAIALANLAEITGNVALGYSLPDDTRFIVAGFSIDYVKKARGTITGTSQCPVPDSSDRVELEVPVEMRDDSGDIVATAVLRTLIGPKR